MMKRGKLMEITFRDIENKNKAIEGMKKTIEEQQKEIERLKELKSDETTYVVVVENEDDFLVTVKDDVNRPNNPDCEQVLRNWIYENYGSRECEYWILDGMTKVSL